jgi:quercetin dioxygenase-like cupin family protein
MTSKDEIEGSHRAVLIDRLADRELGESQPGIYDRPIGLRLLYQDPRSGAEHYLVRYPAGLRARRHRHSAAHTIVVVEGVLHADDQVLRAGSYAHFPAETPMRHEPAPDQDCLFVILFDGPFDVYPVGDA